MAPEEERPQPAASTTTASTTTLTTPERQTCPKCGGDKTPQIRRLTYPRPRDYTVTPDCQCDIEARERAIAEAQEREQRELWERRVHNSGLPKRYQQATFENFTVRPGTEKAHALAEAYTRDFTRDTETGLMLRGQKGAGKTHLVSAATMALLQRGFSVAFWNVPLALDQIRASFNRRPDEETEDAAAIMDRARRADLLVLDDLATEKPSEWVVERIYLVVERRYADLKPVVVTTNASMKELEELLSPKTVSRLAEMTRGLELKGPDYRLGRR